MIVRQADLLSAVQDIATPRFRLREIPHPPGGTAGQQP